MRIYLRCFGSRTAFVVLVVAPVLTGCGGTWSDYSIKDQEWFQRPGRIFGTKSLSLETPPLHVDKPVSPDDLITAEGACPGMAPSAPPAEANALQSANSEQATAPVVPAGGPVALGHTECDVARSVGVPNNVNIAANQRGERLVVLTYTQGPRPGIYTFTSGRLSSVEAVPQQAVPKPAKPARKRSNAG